jgi:Secretion system C-terminal sorting domain
MKKTLTLLLLITSVNVFAQRIGHVTPLTNVRRGDTLDIKWFYKPDTADIRTFQIDFQFKKHLLTHISTTIDTPYVSSARAPEIGYKQFDGYKYNTYSNGAYTYTADTNWAVARNYLILPAGQKLQDSGYIIHNKYLVNNVKEMFPSDTVSVNWARLFNFSGNSIGDNVATLINQKMQVFLKGNYTISGKFFVGAATGMPTLIAYEANTGIEASRTVPGQDGSYVLNNLEQFTKYKIKVQFPTDSLIAMRDRAVTVSDAKKAFDEFTGADINQNYPKTFMTNPLSYLSADLNYSKKLDGADPYNIYASISGLKPIDTSKLINVIRRAEFDSLVIGVNQWNNWMAYSDTGSYIYDSIATSSLINIDIKYYILGDVDRSHGSPVMNAQGQVVGVAYKNKFSVDIPNTSVSAGQPMFLPFNVSMTAPTAALQFEVKYNPKEVKFEEAVTNVNGPWLQYVTNDAINGVVRFGGINNQSTGFLDVQAMPFKLKFSPLDPSKDVSTFIQIRQLMDASNINGDKMTIDVKTQNIQLVSAAYRGQPLVNQEPTVNVYPNPTTGVFELVVNLPSATSVTAYISDNLGRPVMQLGRFTSDDGGAKFVKRVSIPNLAVGMYHLVMYDNKKRYTTKFIKG